MKPTKNVKFTKSLLTCCAAFQVCKQSCPRPLKSLINQETLSPKLLKKLKEQRYSYCVTSRYFTLRHLGRLLTPFITKFYFRATAFMQQRPEVTSENRLGVVGRVYPTKYFLGDLVVLESAKLRITSQTYLRTMLLSL